MFGFLKHLFKLQFLLILIAMIWGIYYPDILKRIKVTISPEKSENSPVKQSELILTKQELAKFNGDNGTPLYLALLGSVYDVSRGHKHYGDGCDYHFFVGRDASVSFVTGQFDHYDEERADDVNTLKHSELLSLNNWRKFYAKDYTYVGKLVGRFYDETGAPTAYLHKFEALVEQASELKRAAEQLRDVYPDCNIQWSEAQGTRVWCTSSSGGKQRDWPGYPRQLYEVGKESYRCACVREQDFETSEVMLKPYDNCERLARECYYRVE